MTGTTRAPVHLKWEEYRRTIRWNLVDADVFGQHRGMYTIVETAELRCAVLRLPPGQGGPMHKSPNDNVIVQIEGEVEWSIGTGRYLVRPCDLFVLPGGVAHTYTNVGERDALFFIVHERPTEQKPYAPVFRKSESEPGWDVPDNLEITHLEWSEYRRQVIYRGGLSERYGYKRGVFPRVATELMVGHSVRVPAGQGSPWHTTNGDVIFVGLVGDLEVYAGSEAYTLRPRDVLVVPPPHHALQNVGLTDAVYFSLGATSAGGPKPVTFEPAVVGDPLAGPGNPIS